MLSIVEEPEGCWTAHRDGTVVGRAELWVRPDRRRWLEFRDCAPEAYPALAAAVPGAVYVTIDAADDRTREALLDGGFVVHRAEDDYVIPTDPARTGLADVRIPPGITFVSAADVDVDVLRRLDDALRQDVPGADGWCWTPEEFAAETFGPDFDPATYLVAVTADGRHVGLVRVWWRQTGPRLGLIAVAGSHRRQGLAKALLAQVFAIAHQRGRTHVTAEADVTNVASQTLLTSLGGRRVGGTVELVRAAP